MVNDASHINLQIEFPSATPTTDFEIEKIEILIKESDRPDIKSIAQFDITDASVGSDKIYNYKHAQYDGWDIPKFSIGRDKHAFYAKNNPELDFFDHNMVYEADEDTTGILYRFPISCWETSTQPKPNICYENENEYRDRNELFTRCACALPGL